MALYEDSLRALAHLFSRVSAPSMEAHIRADIDAWQKRRDAKQHLEKYAGHSTYSDWVIHSQNGHRVDEIQQVWANTLLENLQMIAQRMAEKPDDPRQERKTLNGLSRHRSLLKHPPSSRTPSKLKKHGSGRYLRVLSCPNCNDRFATDLSIEAVIAGDVIGDSLCDAYESGSMSGLIDTLLDGKLTNLAESRERVARAAERAGISIKRMRGQRDQCTACDNNDLSVKHWTLWANGELRFEVAAFESGQAV